MVDAATGTTDAAPTPDAPPAACPTPQAVGNGTASEITVAGDPGAAMGIFDPSIVYPADAPGGAMAYSAVPDQETIRTRIALSADHGATWTFATEPNTPEAATIPSSDTTECPTGACSGKLISEVSSLVYDADDPVPGQRWKLFAHRYLVGAGVALHYRIGTITLQTAAQANGPWSAPSKHLGWTSPASYTSTGVRQNVSTLAGMEDCLALTEPSAMWLPGTVHLAVGCIYITGGGPRIRIELLRSTDHAASWQRVGTLLAPKDAECLAPATTTGVSINAAELFAEAGKIYVAASPSDETGYHGCLVYEVSDLLAGAITRASDNRAIVHRAITTTPTRFAGACAFAAGAGGWALPVAFLGQPRVFRIFRAGLSSP